MSLSTIPSRLPQSLLIDELTAKANLRKDTKLNFVSMLSDFGSRVAQEVRFIGELFPEYTPHDEEFHLNRLFHLGDKLLGNDLLCSLNCTELFILSASIYAHDWGMAVSEVEREYIKSQTIRDGFTKDDYALLDNEHVKFNRYLRDQGCEKLQELTSSHWQEYVRLTHAERSAERVRLYFKKIDSGLGEAIARVCEGHWLDFKFVRDPNNYPTNYAASNETINLRALAVYLRLIDLLDLTQERTPYIIWKYVAPQNLRSKMEWEKHKAIYSISFPTYQNGRIVQVDGGTTNHEVYASLMDLKLFCNDQLKGCNDILTYINDSRYNLNIFHIDWRVLARGFSPISIQFEFDRMRMFHVLSDEIYQGDKYVFLRELLQNSIDAINVRRGILEKKGLVSNEVGLIEVDVIHKENGDCDITFNDDGIGMDEYVVANYLSIAGKSFYNSDDFHKLGLEMDPISKFGVGVLSCFMVVDRLEIETFKDPYALSKSEKLVIHIHSVNQQFRIQSFTSQDAKVGTSFKLFVKADKLKSKARGVPINKLNVTEYLRRIAGFVKIPIKINEGELKTLILHPFEDESNLKQKYPDYRISKLQYNYPWDDVFLPQSIKGAKELLKENVIEIPKHFGLGKVAEGIISFVEPVFEDTILTNSGRSWPGSDFKLTSKNGASKRIKFDEDWVSYDRHQGDSEEREFGKSASAAKQFRVYLDGILVPNAKNPTTALFSSPYDKYVDFFERVAFGDDRFCLPFIVLNFKKGALSRLDLSRTQILEGESHWEDIIRKELHRFLEDRYLKNLLVLDGMSRLFQISKLILFHHIPPKVIKEFITLEKWPVATISDNGKLEIKEWGEYNTKTVYLEPEELQHFYKKLVKKVDSNEQDEMSKKDNWKGGSFMLVNTTDDPEGMSANSILMLSMFGLVLNDTHAFSGFRFLNSFSMDGPALIQSVWAPIVQGNRIDIDVVVFLEKAVKDIESLTFDEFLVILEYAFDNRRELQVRMHLPMIGKFGAPYEDKLSYSFRVLNYDHLNTKNIIGVFSAIILAKIKKLHSPATINELIDKFSELAYFDYSIEYQGASMSDINNALAGIAEFAFKESIYKMFAPEIVSIRSFVDKSIIRDGNVYKSFRRLNKKDGKFNKNYSKPMS